MRTFEIVLILVNLLSLFLRFRKQSQAVWIGVNLFVLFLHGVFEGFRYQMVFSYLFVALIVISTLFKTTARMPGVLSVLAVSLAFVSLMLTSFLAYALPVFELPKPTGSHAVGVRYFHFVDKSRTDPFLDTSTQKRELMVKVYYPARKEAAKPFSSYFHSSPALVRVFTKGYGMPDFLFDHLNLVQTNSKEDLRLSDEQPSYPVILFSHGAGTTLEVQTSQGEDLASHGYIVAAIDHPYVSTATLFPDRIVSAREATTDFHTAEPAEIITQIMADDVRFVMDQLVKMNEGSFASPFKGKLDLNNIGVIGHSVGGAVAYNLAIHDSRVKAAINLDGRVYVAPENPGDIAPFLMLASDQFQGTLQERKSLLKKLEELTEEEQNQMLLMYGSREAYQEAYEKDSRNVLRLVQVLKASGNLFTIEGSAHMKFIDIGLFIGDRRLRELMGIGGKTDPRKCLEITAAVTRAFFDQHLKGGSGDAWKSLIATYPELKKIDLE